MRPKFDDEFECDDRNLITSPGKFEAEPAWVPLLWDRVMSGFSDESVHDGSMAIDGFNLTPEIAALTGLEAHPDRLVCLWSDDQGFVSHMIMTREEFNQCEGFDIGEGDYCNSLADFDYDYGGEAGF